MITRSLIIFLLSICLTELCACRLWAICTKTGYVLSTLPEHDKAFVIDNLDYYFEQSKSMPNGWSLLNYDSIPSIHTTSIHRSSMIAYNDSINYWEKVNTLDC